MARRLQLPPLDDIAAMARLQMETVWQEVFLSSFKLFRDMDTTLSSSAVRDLAVADANCVVETLRQKADADTTDKICEMGG